MRILAVVAVEREATALRGAFERVIVAGIGRVNAAAATVEALVRDGPFDAVLCAGVAGALPRVEPAPDHVEARGGRPTQVDRASPPQIGELVVADACVYFEEGIITPGGFRTMDAIGFPIGPFEGNRVPVEAQLAAIAPDGARRGAIATVATCSGTDAAAIDVARRTGAVAEAMEGAAVVHAAMRLGVPAIEIRAISNTTGDRERQHWNLQAAIEALQRLRPPN